MLYLALVTLPLINDRRKFASEMSNECSQCCSRFEDAIRFTQPECFVFGDSENVRSGIDVALLNIARKISLDYKKSKGRTRKEWDNRVRKFHLMEGQTKSVHELYQDIQNIQNELQGWKKAYENLELEKERIYEEMVLAVNQRENETQVLHKTSK